MCACVYTDTQTYMSWHEVYLLSPSAEVMHDCSVTSEIRQKAGHSASGKGGWGFIGVTDSSVKN